MGFYLEMKGQGGEFAEEAIPPAFWALYLFAGFALSCMAGASYTLLAQMAQEGSAVDRALVWGCYAFLPFYALVGLKLAGVRKFIRFGHCESPSTLSWGFRFFGKAFFPRRVPKSAVVAVSLENRKPTGNLAPRHHDDKQYFIRGHWRVLAQLKDGRRFTLDKHTEPEALAPLFEDLQNWLKEA